MALRSSAPMEENSIYSNLPLLHPKSVRILTILPGEIGDIIECTLEVVNLDEKPDYEALSYCWGPTSPPATIICNNQSTRVTPNLGAALQRLRYPKDGIISRFRECLTLGNCGKPEGRRRLWIDALCINQQDLEERSKQVSFMKDIYDSAKNVVIWLGEHDYFTATAISLIQQIARIAQSEPSFNAQRTMRITTEQDYPQRGDLPALDDEIWDVITLFYENVWFRRIWVVQEAARADARVIMGSHEVSLFDVCIASEWMSKKSGYGSGMRRALAISPAYRLYGFKDGGSLLVMLAGMSHMEATDPRDKIYAFLGLYSSWASLCGKAKPSFKPDYKKTTPEVYGDFVRYFLTLERSDDDDEGSLRIMLRNESFVSQGELAVEIEDEVDSDFPSWVPRWDQCRPPWLGFLLWRLAIKWCPSGESAITIGDATDSTVLSLKGFAISTIDFLKRESELPTPRLESDDASLQTTLDEILTKPSLYAGNDSIKQAFAETLTAGMSKNLTNFEPYEAADLEAYLLHGRETSEGNMFARAVSVQQTFFLTTDGYMGIGSSRMRVGDLVVVLFGGEVLFILRPEGENYRLIGEAYVHGLMSGEAMAMLAAGERQEQWFDLQ